MQMKKKSNHAVRRIFTSVLACSLALPSMLQFTKANEINKNYSLPTVKHYSPKDGSFQITENSRIYLVSEFMPNMDIVKTLQLVSSEMAAQGIGGTKPLDIVYGASSRIQVGDIVVKFANVVQDGADANQAYEMDVTSENLIITVESSTGLKYAMNTLMQNQGVMFNGTIADYPDVVERSLYLDCGRKYFTKETIKAVIKDMAWNKMNVLYLDFSNNNGFRFALDDMSLTWADGAKQDDLSKMVSTKSLTQKDMDEIIELAREYHVTIIPTLNSPGHMDTILKYFPEYQKSKSTIDLENQEAKSFVEQLIDKYASYFRSRGLTSFNISADEATGYDTNSQVYVDYIHGLHTMLKAKGFEVRMFNDGIKEGHASKISKDIKVLYWDPSTANASVLDLLKNGHDVVNFAADYMYYAHGNEGAFKCSPNNIFDGSWVDELHGQDGEIANHNAGWNPGKFSKMAPKQQMSFLGGRFSYPTQGSLEGNLLGASYAIWIDHYGDTATDQEIFQKTYYKYRTMAERSWRVNTDSIKDPLYDNGKGYDIDQGVNGTYQTFFEKQLSVSRAPGGMFEDGTIDVQHSILPQAKEIRMDVADKQLLKQNIEKAESLDANLYVQASWEQLQMILTRAKQIFEDVAATNQEVEEITLELQQLLESKLQLKTADYTKINQLLEQVKQFNPKDYKDFSNVELAVQAIQMGLDITRQKEVDAMAQKLADAIANLEKNSVYNQSELNMSSAQTSDHTNVLWLYGICIVALTVLSILGVYYVKQNASQSVS